MNNFSSIIISLIVGFLGVVPSLFPELVQKSLKWRILSIAIAFFLILLIITFKKWWSYAREISPKLVSFLLWFVHPLAKIIYLFSLVGLIILLSGFNSKIILLGGLILIVSLSSIKWFPIKSRRFEDNFEETLKSWEVVTGNPSINEQFGNPQPDLDLHFVSGGTNCLLYLVPIDSPRNGSIECDVYLEPGALFNIIFHVDSVTEKWYMARLDTRNGMKDGFLKGGRSGWAEFSMGKSNSSPKTWHRMKLELDGPKIKLYRDGNLLAEMGDSEFKDGRIGIFNEVGEVHIDNFLVEVKG
ncbi:MAG: hypothetical protein CEN89_725 [Candidatus Berkelbacteria bacterium Licking1014_7]|uniref:3-keto-disaccharide hydrolase domain-containing protein n=1 Tax=Candidatus Berkelbacteria bacterium Licking1014_7 TaxID=2017147 RepID=A0A554LIC5_9BACT|nr:MAG: hypothetical protein CEN89_725 [Candidatus Berkelbacteria bacterium Licking1014_7]